MFHVTGFCAHLKIVEGIFQHCVAKSIYSYLLRDRLSYSFNPCLINNSLYIPFPLAYLTLHHPQLQSGTANYYPSCSYCSRHHRRGLLVYPTRPTDMIQLEAKSKKQADGLPGLMTFIHAVCKLSVLETRKAHRLLTSVHSGLYAILQNSNLPMQVQPQIFCALSLAAWA